MRAVIGLLTDFGTRDRYVAAMKGAILQRVADAQIVDVTHEIPPGDVLEGAWTLWTVWRELPPRTVFVAVVDPEVGSARRLIGVQAEDRLAVGPDNGLFTFVARGARDFRAIELLGSSLPGGTVSPVFHGRDVLAPVGVTLASGTPLAEVGDPLAEIVFLPLPPPVVSERAIIGHVVHIDRFGNVVTDIPGPLLPRTAFAVGVAGQLILHRVEYYAQAPYGEVVALVNSAGYLELAMRGTSAAERLRVQRRAVVEAREIAVEGDTLA